MHKDYHHFQVNGDSLLSLSTGEVFLLDDLGADLIRSGKTTALEAVEALKGSYDADKIATAFTELSKILSRPPADHSSHNPPRMLRALCLNVTHRCNLACGYCFAERLTGDRACDMTGETAGKALDFLFEKSHGVNRLQVDFFGGEPLMVIDVVKDAVKHGRILEKNSEKQFLFTLTTNATLLTPEIIDFIEENRISLILSLDGPEGVNDKFRKYRNGGGSFSQIIKNIRSVRDRLKPDDYYIRGTYTAETPDILETLKFFDSEGFYNVSLEPVSASGDKSYAFSEESLREILDSYHKAARWMLDKNLKFYHFNLETDNPLCLTRRITGCGAGVEYMAVDPAGDLYPCHQFVEFENFRLGSVYRGIENREMSDLFRNSTLYGKEGCGSCWARFYCGGGCHFQHFITNGSIDKPARFQCDIFKGRLEGALWYNARRNSAPAKEIIEYHGCLK